MNISHDYLIRQIKETIVMENIRSFEKKNVNNVA